MADKAIAAAKKYPVVNFALKGMGVNVDKIKAELTPSNPGGLKPKSAESSYRDRLNKLK